MFKTLREIYSELWQAELSKQGNFPRQHLRESYLEANRGKREGGGGDKGETVMHTRPGSSHGGDTDQQADRY